MRVRDESPAAAVTSEVNALHPDSLGNVSIVHDYLNQRGGAEKVVLELCDMWPHAPLYTSLYRPDSTYVQFQERKVHTTMLNYVPVDAGFRNLFPFYPVAFRALGALPGDIVIASSSGWAHMARAAAGALHVVYCYTPARWLYRADYLSVGERRAPQETALQPFARLFRTLDQRAARRADLYIAISHEVRKRIKAIYGISAVVVYPPVDTDRLTPRPRGTRLLVISRLLPYKRVDLVVRAAKRLGMGLDIVGSGPMLDDLRQMAGRDVVFHGSASDASVTELLEGCRAVCVAGEDDFGIVAVEAQAAGKPVIAYGRGGALETVDENITGVFFYEQTDNGIVAAIAASERLGTPPEDIARRAQRFSRAMFRRNLIMAIGDKLVEPAI